MSSHATGPRPRRAENNAARTVIQYTSLGQVLETSVPGVALAEPETQVTVQRDGESPFPWEDLRRRL
jgi:hypothetical protein